MRKDDKPTDEQLIELYQAALDFKKTAPWEWLYDADLICVENPEDKTIGYCSVMGRVGRHYALGVYLGETGLSGFCEMLEKAESIPYHQALHYQDCIMCSFEDRDQLHKADRQQIKALGLSFRGRNAWPMFRRLEPGYAPWFINQAECVFLTHALRQTVVVAREIADGKVDIDLEQGKTILRRSKKKNGQLQWFSTEIQLNFPRIRYFPVEIKDDLLIQRIKRAKRLGDDPLQADICYLPFPVQEKSVERPFFPRIFILAEENSGLIIDFETYQNVKEDANVVLNKLIGICLEKGVPKEIQVRSEKMAAILEDLCQRAKIELAMVETLSSIDQALEEMANVF